MIIDCDSCTVRGPDACGDCVVTALLGGPPGEIDEGERQALEALAGSGLVATRVIETARAPASVLASKLASVRRGEETAIGGEGYVTSP